MQNLVERTKPLRWYRHFRYPKDMELDSTSKNGRKEDQEKI